MLDRDRPERATFHHIAPRRVTSPTPREIRWLKHVERHGPQSSAYLHELTADTHRDPDTTRRQLQKLRAGGLLHCPPQQRATERAEFNPYIYDLAPAGRMALVDRDLAEATITPSGHWVHRYMTACVTGSIDIAAARAGVAYIPAHRILQRAGVGLAVSIGRHRLIPDQLFGLDYGGRYRFYCLEADRGTEVGISAGRRKSWRVMLESYRALLGEGLYRRHFQLTAPMILLVALSSRTRMEGFLVLARQVMGEAAHLVLAQVIDGFEGPFRPLPPALHLFEEQSRRPVGGGFRIDEP